MIDVAALGECLIDFTPNGENAQGIALFARNPGGAPANVLAMNARLGGKTAFIGKVGRDGFGDFLRQTLLDSGIDVSGLAVDEKVPTTLAFVQLDANGDRSFTFYRSPGADIMLRESEVDTALLDDCAIFHFGSVSMTADPCRTATLSAARYARQKGKLVSFDPNYRPLPWDDTEEAVLRMKEGIRLADILKVSEAEMQLVTGESDPERGSKALLDMGPSLVLVSMGAKGAYCRNAVCAGALPTFGHHRRRRRLHGRNPLPAERQDRRGAARAPRGCAPRNRPLRQRRRQSDHHKGRRYPRYALHGRNPQLYRLRPSALMERNSGYD